MTRFPRQLAVAVVVLFAFTFLSGCGSDKEDKKEETNNDVSQVVTPDENGDTQPQPDKKSCTVRKNIETKIVSDDGSGGKLTGKNCKQKNAKLKVGDICEFECEDPKDYNKTGHIKCGKDEKIEITAKCNRTDEKKKADEEAEDKKSIVQLLITLVGPGKDNAVQRFIDMKAKGKADGWDNIKEKLKQLDENEELKKELKKQFEDWETARQKDTAKQNIKGILRKARELSKIKKNLIERWVDGTIDDPIPMERDLKNPATRDDTVKECKAKINRWNDIRYLSLMMVGVTGSGKNNERKGKIESYLGKLSTLSTEADEIRKQADKRVQDRMVKDLAGRFCAGEIKTIMRKPSDDRAKGVAGAGAAANDPIPVYNLPGFETYIDTVTVDVVLPMYRKLSNNVDDTLGQLADKFGRNCVHDRLTTAHGTDPEVVRRIEKYLDSKWTGFSNVILRPADEPAYTAALNREPQNFARFFVEDQFRSTFPEPRQPHLKIHDYVMNVARITDVVAQAIVRDVTPQVRVKNAAVTFAKYRMIELVNADHALAAGPPPHAGKIILNKSALNSVGYVNGFGDDKAIQQVKLPPRDILTDVEANAPL